MQKKLSEFSVGEKGKVVFVEAEGKLKRRLFDMGVTPAVEIYLRKRAPLGDPIEVTIRRYELTLRISEAKKVLMEVE